MEHFLEVFTDKANLLGAAVVAALGGVFGAHWQVFALFFVLNVVDFFYGWLKGKQTGTVRKGRSRRDEEGQLLGRYRAGVRCGAGADRLRH